MVRNAQDVKDVIHHIVNAIKSRWMQYDEKYSDLDEL